MFFLRKTMILRVLFFNHTNLSSDFSFEYFYNILIYKHLCIIMAGYHLFWLVMAWIVGDFFTLINGLKLNFSHERVNFAPKNVLR